MIYWKAFPLYRISLENAGRSSIEGNYSHREFLVWDIKQNSIPYPRTVATMMPR